MELYCPLVSVGCYCIVEDTKMSRWSSTGPHEAVQKFLKKHPEFELVSTEYYRAAVGQCGGEGGACMEAGGCAGMGWPQGCGQQSHLHEGRWASHDREVYTCSKAASVTISTSQIASPSEVL